MRIRLSIAVALATLLATSLAEAKTYYVRTSGNDSNAGTKKTLAWRTLERARQVMVAGDIVYVGGGTYNETVNPRTAGTSSKPIRYLADVTGARTGDAGPVVIAPSNNLSVIADGALYTRFEGFSFQAASGVNYGLLANNCDGLVLKNCRFTSTAYGALLVNSTTQITGCTFDQVAAYPVLSYYRNLTIQTSEITNCGTYAVYHYAPPASQRYKLSISNSSITQNYAGPYAFKSDVTLSNTPIQNNTTWGLAVDQGNLSISGAARAITGNGSGLYLVGNGTRSSRSYSGVDLSNNTTYGVYATDCNLTLKTCKLENTAGWAAALVYSSLNAPSTPICNNDHGVLVYTLGSKKQSKLTNAQVVDNRGYGIYHYSDPSAPAALTIDKCQVTGNASYSLLSYYGTITCSNSKFANNASGLYLHREAQYGGIGTHKFTKVVIEDTPWHGIFAPASNVTLNTCEVRNCANYGVLCYDGNLTITRSIFDQVGTSSGYAAYHYAAPPATKKSPKFVLKTTSIKNCYGGPYAENTNLTIDNCTIEQNKYWGIAVVNGELTVAKRYRALHNNGFGMYLAGNPPSGSRKLQWWDVSANGDYGIFAADCLLTLTDCKVENMTGWGLALSNTQLTAKRSPIRNNGQGVLVYSVAGAQQPVLTNVEISSNAGAGLYHLSHETMPGLLTLTRCTIRNNGSYGVQSLHADVAMNNILVEDNAHGLHLYRLESNAGQGSYGINNSIVRNTTSGHSIYAAGGRLDLSDCRIENGSQYGVLAVGDDFTAIDCVFDQLGTSSGYATFHTDTDPDPLTRGKMRLVNCTISNSYGGAYAERTDLTIDNCLIEGNTNWAIVSNYGRLDLLNQANGIHNNGCGIYVAGNHEDGQRAFENVDVSSNGSYGFFASDCDLVLRDCVVQQMQSWGLGLSNATIQVTNTPIVNNGHGIYIASHGEQRIPTLENMVIANSAGYGVYHQSDPNTPATLTVRRCRVDGYGTYGLVNLHGRLNASDSLFRGDRSTSDNGLYSYLAPQMNLERVTVMNHRNWGLMSYGCNALVRNSIISNNAYGAYLYNYDGDTTATLWNSTLANNAVYGIVQYSGQASLINCIVSSDAHGAAGVHVEGGAMSHSHNLLYGYANPFVGTGVSDGEVIGEPRFQNSLAGDFSLQGSSAAINRGRDMPGLVDFDIAGVARPMYGKWEIGAFEYTEPGKSVRPVEWKEVR